MSIAATLSGLLPSLRRLAAALIGSPRAPADELVLRALHQMLREPPPENEAGLKAVLQARLARLAEMRPAPALTPPAQGMERALLELPASHRAALVLVCVERCSYAEAAKALGISRNVLIGRLASARQMIARHMQDEAQGRRASAPYLRLVK